MKTILAVDFSPVTDLLIDEVARRPWPPGSEFRILHVVDQYPVVTATGYVGPFLGAEAAEVVETATRQCAGLVQKLRGAELNAHCRVLTGYASTMIVDDAKDWGADLIALGWQGHGALTRFLLGSTAQSIVRGAHCSVEIVRAPLPESQKRAPGEKRILIATDGSGFSAAAIKSVAERPWGPGSEVRIVEVVHVGIPATDLWYAAGDVAERLRLEDTQHAVASVTEATALFGKAGLSCTSAVLEGSPKWRIVDEASEWKADLIVMGSHGRRGVTRLLLGSVSEAVAMHAHCSVEVIRKSA